MNIGSVIRNGLQSTPKYLPDWYPYDKKGLQLFNRLTENKHYYMYTSEIELLQDHAQDIAAATPSSAVLIDMGSGNCVKSRMIIDVLLERQSKLQFIPVDISEEFLLKTTAKISNEYASKIDIKPIAAEYGEALEHLRTVPGDKLIIWLGGGFQNQPYKVQVERIKRLSQVMSDKTNRKKKTAALLLLYTQLEHDKFIFNVAGATPSLTDNDLLVISLDVTQNAERVKLAYLDSEGIMADFYKNSLLRLNRDYGSKFDTDKFNIEVDFIQRKEVNFCSYVTVQTKAKEDLSYNIPGLDMSLVLKKGEGIRLFEGEGTSCKYNIEQIQNLVQAGNQVLEKYWVDTKQHVAICCIRKETVIAWQDEFNI